MSLPLTIDRLVPAVAEFTAGNYALRSDLERLAAVLRADAPEAVVFYAARTLEVLAGDAVRRVGPEPDEHLNNNLVTLTYYTLLPQRIGYWSNALRWLGNDVRHIDRPVTSADVELAGFAVERVLAWFFHQYEGIGQLTTNRQTLRLAGDTDLVRWLTDFDDLLAQGDTAPLATLPALPAGRVSSTVAAVVADVLISRRALSAAAALLHDARVRDPNNARLRQLDGLRLSREGQLDAARAVLEERRKNERRNEEYLGILAGVYKRLWWNQRRVQNYLDAAYANYRAGWKQSNKQNAYLGINVASTACFRKSRGYARETAEIVYRLLEERRRALTATLGARAPAPDYWEAATRAEAALLCDRPDEARDRYNAALEAFPTRAGDHQSTLDQLNALLPELGYAGDAYAFLGRPVPSLGTT
jgi:hypothetical protein